MNIRLHQLRTLPIYINVRGVSLFAVFGKKHFAAYRRSKSRLAGVGRFPTQPAAAVE